MPIQSGDAERWSWSAEGGRNPNPRGAPLLSLLRRVEKLEKKLSAGGVLLFDRWLDEDGSQGEENGRKGVEKKCQGLAAVIRFSFAEEKKNPKGGLC